MPTININNKEFNYSIVKKKKKNIAIKINEKGEIIVTSPIYVKDEYIKEILIKRGNWILSKLDSIKAIEEEKSQRKLQDGAEILYLGEKHEIKIEEGDYRKTKVVYNGETFNIYLNKSLSREEKENNIRASLTEFLKSEAKKVLSERTRTYGEKLSLIPKEIRVKEVKTIWGSCSGRGNINYNWRLIMTPLPVFDYVIIHELCHLRERNHSKNFWNLVESIYPDYKKCREWLKMNGKYLYL